MDEGEYVETSDAEEREEQEALNSLYWDRDHVKANIYLRDDSYSPRKRVKLYHTGLASQSIPETPSKTLRLSEQPVSSPMTCPEGIFGSTPKSSSLVQTPVHLHDSPLPPIWPENDDVYSQDPLLLSNIKSSETEAELPDVSSSPCSAMSKYLYDDPDLTAGSYPPSPSSPSRSPLSRARSLSLDPLSLFEGPPHDLKPTNLPEDVHITTPSNSPCHAPDPTFDSPLPLLSPLSSPPQSPRHTLHEPQPLISPVPTPSPHRSPSPAHNIQHEDGIPLLTDAILIPNIPRYPLRQRGINQLRPYTVEQIQYKIALKSNPDAIVKPSRADHRRHDHVDDYAGESQELWQPDGIYEYESDGGVRLGRRKSVPRRSPSPRENGIEYPELLQDLPSTDEDEAKELRALSKEARRAVRERRAKEAREKLKGKQKAKPFPLPKKYLESTHPPKEGERNPRRVTTPSTDVEFPSRPGSPVKTPNKRPPTPIFTPQASTSFHDPFNDLFDTNSPIRLSDDAHDLPADNFNDTPHAEDVASQDDDDASPESSLPMADVMPRKHMKALQRMLPAFMVKDFVKGPNSSQKARIKRQRSATVESDSDREESKLPPGQTRTRRAENPKDVREIKGDTESSDDDRSSAADSDTPSERLRSDFHDLPRRPFKHEPAEVMELTDSPDDSSDSGVDDEEIKAHLAEDVETKDTFEQREPNRRIRDENLIDWMLARTRTVGIPKQSKKRKRSSGQSSRNTRHRLAATSSTYKIDVTTGGVRRERQTLLNFDRQSKTRTSGHRRDGYQPRPSSSRHAMSGTDDDVGHDRDQVHVVLDYDPTKKKRRKEKEKARRARAKTNGIYTFQSGDTHLITGRRETAMVTVDMEDEGFYQTLAPLSQDWARSFKPPPKPKTSSKPQSSRRPAPLPQNSHHDHVPISVDAEIVSSRPKRRHARRKIRGDFGIPILHSGLSFGPNTYIGKGWLHDLISVASSSTPPPTPTPFSLRGVDLSASMDIESFSRSLDRVFEGLFDLAASLPGLDSADDAWEWCTVEHATCQLLSWFLTTSSETDSAALLGMVEQQTSAAISRMRELHLDASTMDVSTFSVCWFVVELSARLGLSFPISTTSVLGLSISLLVDSLVTYGLEQTIAPIRDEETLDGSTTPQYAAELWVRLFHLLDSCYPADIAKKESHPVWLVVKQALEATTLTKSCFEGSEATWCVIFSLCALTQFSIHGMTTATSRIPPSWELVFSALKKIRLVADPVADGAQSSKHLDKRDQYIGLITLRCFHLWNRWHWQLDDASVLFNQLVEIFRSRKFAGLRHEVPDYPSFMLQHDWSLLSHLRSEDSAFVLFLKLLVPAAGHDDGNTGRALTPKAKKLLSLAIPVGSLPFSKKNPTVIQDLSMLYNRLSAIAIGIYLDPAHSTSRLSQAKAYVDFADADDTTRVAVVRGMMNLAILLVKSDMSIDGIGPWIEAMATVLTDEFKKLDSLQLPETQINIIRDRIYFSVQVLVGSVRQILEAYKSKSDYPDPALLSSLHPILRTQALSVVPRTSEEIHRLLQTFLDARRSTLPAPERPRILPLPAEETQESQDEYGVMDIDYDDPALLVALGIEVVAPAPKSDRRNAEESLKKIIYDNKLDWLCWHILMTGVTELSKPVPLGDPFVHIDKWLACWLGCADVQIRVGSKSWNQYLDLPSRQWFKVSGSRRQRIDLSLMFEVLKLDPMTYIEYKDRYIETLITSLASTHSALASKFVTLMLSIDGCRHPLVIGLATDTTEYRITPESFPNERKAILQVMINNLAGRLREEVAGDRSMVEDNQKYIGFLIKLFQAMETSCMELPDVSQDRIDYIAFVHDIFRMLEEHQELRTSARLLFWRTWERALE
ncbi:Protein mms22 [Hypsizygus marmoreus]|uniref:Protein mms22 n=1 Tax=Hypsizygus marmoreus TaxID=39966 RepID=A0A369JI71_HYPMA|nr:Protein mms22 [Hypsizygus marmoreus]